MLKLMNLRPFAVEGTDPDTEETFACAARPGTVEVSDRLGRNLVKQVDNWKVADDEPKAEKAPKKGES